MVNGQGALFGASSMYAWQFALSFLRPGGGDGIRRPSSRCRTIYNLVYREEEREMIPL